LEKIKSLPVYDDEEINQVVKDVEAIKEICQNVNMQLFEDQEKINIIEQDVDKIDHKIKEANVDLKESHKMAVKSRIRAIKAFFTGLGGIVG